MDSEGSPFRICEVCKEGMNEHSIQEKALCKIAKHLESISKRMGGK